MMKISVIVPFYNCGNFAYKNLTTLSTALQKASQSGLDYEILVVDDNGRREDVAQLGVVIQAIGDSNISIYHSPKNLGLSGARNIGISLTTGDYIWCVDADDYVDLDEFVKASQPLMLLQPDIMLLDSYVSGPDYEYKMDGFGLNANSLIQVSDATICQYIEAASFYAWRFIAKRQLYTNLDYPQGMYMEDIPTTSCLFAKAKTVWYHDKPIVHYRQHLDSIMKTWSAKKSLDFIRAVALMRKRIDATLSPVPRTIQHSIERMAYTCLFWSFADAATHRIDNLFDSQRKCRELFVKEFGEIDVGFVIKYIWRDTPSRAIGILAIKFFPSLFNYLLHARRISLK